MYLKPIDPVPAGVGRSDRFGAWIKQPPDDLLLSDVPPGSATPADELHIGDVFTALESTAARRLTSSDARRPFVTPPLGPRSP